MIANLSGFEFHDPKTKDEGEDIFILSHVSKKVASFDAGLFETKWFDYRRMSDLTATGAYIDAYIKSYRGIYARELDRDRAEHIRLQTKTEIVTGAMRGDKKCKRKLSAFWKGRQVADALGMPYETYLDNAFTYRMKRWQRAYMPQPEHLYHEYDVEKIQERWISIKSSSLILPQDESFLVDNYRGFQYQVEFLDWLFEQVDNKGNSPWMIANLVSKRLISMKMVHNRFDPDLVRKVELEINS